MTEKFTMAVSNLSVYLLASVCFGYLILTVVAAPKSLDFETNDIDGGRSLDRLSPKDEDVRIRHHRRHAVHDKSTEERQRKLSEHNDIFASGALCKFQYKKVEKDGHKLDMATLVDDTKCKEANGPGFESPCKPIMYMQAVPSLEGSPSPIELVEVVTSYVCTLTLSEPVKSLVDQRATR